MDIFLLKMPDGSLRAASEHDHEKLRKIKAMQPLRVTLRRVRNYQFHKKYFSLMNFAYENWEPELTEYKDFDRFRKDITILAGYYDQTVRLNGDVRLEAKSISFGSMSEDEFEKLYAATVEVICQHVLASYDGDTLRAILDTVESFS